MPRTRAALVATALALPALAAALTACGPGTPHVIGTGSTPTTTPTDSGPPTATPTHTRSTHLGSLPVLVDCTHHGHVRPSSYVTACADANNAVTKLRWTSWRPGAAAGTGVERSNDCTPNCAAGHFHVYKVRVAVTAPKPWPGHNRRHYFTRMKVVFTGAHPGPDTSETFHLTT